MELNPTSKIGERMSKVQDHGKWRVACFLNAYKESFWFVKEWKYFLPGQSDL